MNDIDFDKVLKSYGDLDGAVVLEIEFKTGADISQRTASIKLKAFLENTEVESGWRILRISTIGHTQFGWCEGSWDTNLVLNYPVKRFRVGEYNIIDFDPLHSIKYKNGMVLSSCFLGGAVLRIEEIAI